MDDEWIEEVPERHMPVNDPYVLISYNKGSSEKYRMYVNKSGAETLGLPSHVQIMLSKTGDKFKIKLLPCGKDALRARPLRKCSSDNYFRMGGGSNLVKKYKMHLGYYIHTGNGVFEWKMT